MFEPEALTTALADLAEALDVRGVGRGDALQLLVCEGRVETAAKRAVLVCRQPRLGGALKEGGEQGNDHRVDAHRLEVASQRHRSLHGRRPRALDQRGDGEGGGDDEVHAFAPRPERVPVCCQGTSKT